MAAFLSDRVLLRPRLSAHRQDGIPSGSHRGWKYIRYLELDGMDELYDLKADPYETRNLISQPHAEQTLKAMRKELGQLLKQTSARESTSATPLKQSTSVSR